MNARFIVDLTAAGRTASGAVHAACVLQFSHDDFFPHSSWSDFVVVVLGWWSEASAELLSGERTSARVRFMEGPYLVEACKVEGNRLKLDCVEDGLRRRIVIERTVEALPFVASLLAACDEVLTFCEARGWGSRDLDKLRAAADSLRTEAAAFEKRWAPS